MGDPAYFNKKIEDMNKLFLDMKLTISRPGDTRLNAIVEVRLHQVLRGVVIFKGMVIEWVVVKGWEEELVRNDSQPDIWGESRSLVSVENTLSQPNSLPPAHRPPSPLGSIDSDSNVETFHLYSTLSKSHKW